MGGGGMNDNMFPHAPLKNVMVHPKECQQMFLVYVFCVVY